MFPHGFKTPLLRLRFHVGIILLSLCFTLTVLPATAAEQAPSAKSVKALSEWLLAPRVFTAVLVVGNNLHLGSQAKDLLYAEADALRVAKQLATLMPAAPMELLISTVQPETLQTVQREGWTTLPPTLENLELAIDRLHEVIVKAETEGTTFTQVLVYFSSHGEPDGSLHLDEYLSPEQKRILLQRLGATQVLMVADACHAGVAMRSGSKASPAVNQKLPAMPRDPAKAPRWLGAIASTDQVPELDAIGGGFLTMVTLSGLYGLADLNGDGVISWGELTDFATQQVKDQPPAPLLVVRSGLDPSAPLVNLKALGRTGLRLLEDFPTGIVQVYRMPEGDPNSAASNFPRNGELLTQFIYRHGTPMELRLSPGRYLLVRLLEDHELKGAGIKATAEELLEARLYPAKVELFVITPKSRVLISGSSMQSAALAKNQVRGVFELPEGMSVALVTAEQAELITQMRDRYRRTRALPPSSLSAEVRLQMPGSALTFGTAQATESLARGFQLSWLQPLATAKRLSFGGGLAFGYDIAFQPSVYMGNMSSELNQALTLNRLSAGGLTRQTWHVGRLSLGIQQRVSWSPAFALGKGGLPTYEDSSCSEAVAQCSNRFIFSTDMTAEMSLSMLVRVSPQLELGPVMRLEGLFFNQAKASAPHYTWSLGVELRQPILKR